MENTAANVSGTGVPDTAAGVLDYVKAQRAAADRAEAQILEAAVVWAGMHATTDPAMAAAFTVDGCACEAPIAGEGAPLMTDLAETEFAAVLGLRSDAGKRLIGEAVELKWRLPRVWAQVHAGRLPAWRGRRIAARTIDLTQEAAAYVDRHLAMFAARVSLAQIDRLVDEARARFDAAEAEQIAAQALNSTHVTVHDYQLSFHGTVEVTAELEVADALALQQALIAGAASLKEAGSEEAIDTRRAQALGNLARAALAGETSWLSGPAVTLYVHLSDTALGGLETVASRPPRPTGNVVAETQLARLEGPERLLLASQVAAWCARPGASVTVKPVIDLNAQISTTAYEVPARLREQVTLRDRTCLFPWCTRTARRADMDHVIPYDHAHPGQGGPTASSNISALCRRHHRAKTHHRWRVIMPTPGVAIWTSPHGHVFRRDHTGTTPLTKPTEVPPRAPAYQPARYRGDGPDLLPTGPPGHDLAQDTRDHAHTEPPDEPTFCDEWEDLDTPKTPSRAQDLTPTAPPF